MLTFWEKQNSLWEGQQIQRAYSLFLSITTSLLIKAAFMYLFTYCYQDEALDT